MNKVEYADIASPRGTKVVFAARGGYEFQKEQAKQILTIGETYTIDYTEIGDWSTVFILEEFPEKRFNSCLFCVEGWKP